MLLILEATGLENDLGYARIEVIGMHLTANARLICNCTVRSSDSLRIYSSTLDWTELDTAITLGAYTIKQIKALVELTKEEL